MTILIRLLRTISIGYFKTTKAKEQYNSRIYFFCIVISIVILTVCIIFECFYLPQQVKHLNCIIETEMGVEQLIQKKLGVPLSHIIITYSQNHHEEQVLTIVSILDAKQFSKIVQKFLPKIVVIPQALKTQGNQTYSGVWAILRQTAKQLSINIQNYQPPTSFLIKTKIENQLQIIDEDTWKALRTLSHLLLQIMIKNENALHFITEMDENYQIQIKEYLETHQNFINNKMEIDPFNITINERKVVESNQVHNDPHLLQKLDELEHCLSTRDIQLSSTKLKFNQLKEQLEFTKIILQEKQVELNQLKNRISVYSETDILFEEKDEEIAKLNAELTNIKMNSHLKNNELTNEITKIRQLNKELQNEKLELMNQNEQLIAKNENLLTNKEESQTAHKKVITNLKQKIKVLNDRLTEQQKNMMELMEKEQKDKEIFDLSLKNCYEHDRNSAKLIIRGDDSVKNVARKRSKLVDELGDLQCFLATSENSLKKYFSLLFGDIDEKCTKKLCIAIRQQFVRVVQQIIQINNDTDCLIYITPSNRLQCILNQLNRIRESCQQNMKLKQKLGLLQSEGWRGETSKQSLEEINKLKKRLLVMKRNLDEVETKRKEELEILVSVIGQNFTFDVKS